MDQGALAANLTKLRLKGRTGWAARSQGSVAGRSNVTRLSGKLILGRLGTQ